MTCLNATAFNLVPKAIQINFDQNLPSGVYLDTTGQLDWKPLSRSKQVESIYVNIGISSTLDFSMTNCGLALLGVGDNNFGMSFNPTDDFMKFLFIFKEIAWINGNPPDNPMLFLKLLETEVPYLKEVWTKIVNDYSPSRAFRFDISRYLLLNDDQKNELNNFSDPQIGFEVYTG